MKYDSALEIAFQNVERDKTRELTLLQDRSMFTFIQGRAYSGRVISASMIALTSPNYSSKAEVKLADPIKHLPFLLDAHSVHISAADSRTHR